jgi:hypothetical protein
MGGKYMFPQIHGTLFLAILLGALTRAAFTEMIV